MSRLFVRGASVGAALCCLCVGSAAVAQPNFYVVNGHQATAADLRATVALTDPYGEQICTGTLVTDRIVMTAAHCVSTEAMDRFIGPENFLVVVGAIDVRDAATNLAAARAVEGVYPSCGFLENDGEGPGPNDATSFGRSDDVAFLRLTAPVPASLMVPVPILPEASRDLLSVGASITITGFGIHDLATEAAGELYTGTTQITRVNDWELASTRDPRGMSTDSCYGDSGGPVYLDDGGDVHVVGVVSRGNADSDFGCGDGGIYPIATSYLDLLQQASDATPVACMGSGPPPDPGTGDLDQLLLDVCELDCCGGSPNASHPLCGVCPPGTIPDTCFDPTDTVPAQELDDLQAEICAECASGALTHRACWVCAGDEPDAGIVADAGTEADAATEADGGVDGDGGMAPPPGDGCGCRVAGPTPDEPLAGLALFGLALLVRRRRRTRRLA